jgi:predicted DNA-binding transcriptional regulator AlpA
MSCDVETPTTIPCDWWTVSEAVYYLRAPSENTLREWIRRDPTFPRPRRIGRRSMFSRAEIVEWAQNRPRVLCLS